MALRGGLGNQLFQFSYALFLARHGQVGLDLSCVRHGIPALFDVPVIGEQARRMVVPVTRFLPSPSGRFPLAGRLARKVMGPGRIVLDESAQGAEPEPGETPAWWFGYWQRLHYAEAVIPVLRAGLTLDPAAIGQDRRHPVARIHVRRGDYAGNPWELPADWYGRALDMVHAISADPVEVEVVTNDPQWCTRHLDLGQPYRVRPTGSALEDMRTLAASDFVVISRSTFSWWAAAVSGATVVAPAPWFPDLPEGETHELLPGTWLSCAL